MNKESNNINFKNVIYGPTVSPIRWYSFPLKNSYEENWSCCINKLLAYIVQSERVKMHLIKRSKKIANIETKYIVSNGCVVNKDIISMLPLWENRVYDILIYAKFADLNREKELSGLISNLNNTYSLAIIRYGNHSKQLLANTSSNSKIVIYYSFYDCWPSSLMEIVSQGVYPIVQQCELIGIYGKCVENIDRNISYVKKYIIDIISHKYDAKKIANYYNTKNNCMNVLRKTFSMVYYKVTNTTIKI